MKPSALIHFNLPFVAAKAYENCPGVSYNLSAMIGMLPVDWGSINIHGASNAVANQM